jgi:hypothetical protein
MKVQDFIQSAGELIDQWIYVMGGMMLETQPGNAIIAIGIPPVPVTIPASGNLSTAKALTAATNPATFSLKKNGVEFGTMGFLASGTVGSFVISADTSFNGSSDYLTVHNPASPDPTLALMGFSIWGRR